MQIARTHPMLAASAAALLLAGALGTAAITGVMPFANFKSGTAAAPQPGPAVRCASCGVVEAIRKVEVRGEPRGTAWRVIVRLDDGSVRALSQPVAPRFAVGDRVRIISGAGGSGLERT